MAKSGRIGFCSSMKLRDCRWSAAPGALFFVYYLSGFPARTGRTGRASFLESVISFLRCYFARITTASARFVFKAEMEENEKKS
jgi:hypothetical protein